MSTKYKIIIGFILLIGLLFIIAFIARTGLDDSSQGLAEVRRIATISHTIEKANGGIGILPYIFMVLGLVTWFLSLIFFLVYNFLLKNEVWKSHLTEFIIYVLIVYLSLFVMTLVIIILEGNKIDLSFKTKIIGGNVYGL